jgi:hypothetical protein
LNSIVEKVYLESDIISQKFVLGNLLSQAGKTRKRVAWKHSPEMANNIAFIVVFGRLNNDNPDVPALGHICFDILANHFFASYGKLSTMKDLKGRWKDGWLWTIYRISG